MIYKISIFDLDYKIKIDTSKKCLYFYPTTGPLDSPSYYATEIPSITSQPLSYLPLPPFLLTPPSCPVPRKVYRKNNYFSELFTDVISFILTSVSSKL